MRRCIITIPLLLTIVIFCKPPPLPYLVDDRLHVRLVFVVAIEQSGPLLGADTKTSIHCHLDDLTVMLTTERLIGTKLQSHKEKQGNMIG